jgi:hypothetical protein
MYNSYVIFTHFNLFGEDTTCTRYISYVGIEHIIHNVLFSIIHIYDNMLFVELGATDFQLICDCLYFLIFE